MFLFGNFVSATAWLVDVCFTILFWLIFIRAIISWVNPDPYNPIVQFLQRVTEPVLVPIRRALRMQFWTIDISPALAIITILFLQKWLVPTLYRIAATLQ